MSRVAIITGGARGIGRAVGISLAADGWKVALCFRTSEAQANETAEAIRRAGGEALVGRYDVSEPAACEALVSRVLREWRAVDALVNAAGPYHRVPLLEASLDQWHAMFDNNLHPVFYLSRLLAPHMIERRAGRIVNFGLAGADKLVGQPNLTAHAISKLGVLVLTRTLARVLGPHGITANAVSPGFIDTGGASAEELSRMTPAIPAGYLGEPRDAVAAVRFLLSEEARYVNGANLVVSGGWGV
jgi:3-oxoacyl-[acyl-carrier protein] reductase